MTKLLGKSPKYMLIHTIKEIMIIGEVMGSRMGLAKEDEMVKRTKMAKIQLTKGKSQNGSGNDEAFGEVSKTYDERYNKEDHD